MRLWIGVAALVGLALAAAGVLRWIWPPALSADELAARYAGTLARPAAAIRVYHLGHSLVGRDMPAMLAQMAEAAGFPGHGWDSQLGWGASLKDHGTGAVAGFAEENAHPRHRPAREALASGDYDAVVLTEMVELRDAIRWHQSPDWLAEWATAADAGRPGVPVFLYETWHRLDDADGWLERLDGDLQALWEGKLIRPAMAREGVPTIWQIPAGQVLAQVVREAEAGRLPGLTSREDLFARTPEGAVDPIHLNDIGAYLLALTHFAVLYGRSPEGLPAALARADGSAATAPAPETAAALQRVVWQVVRRYAGAGITP